MLLGGPLLLAGAGDRDPGAGVGVHDQARAVEAVLTGPGGAVDVRAALLVLGEADGLGSSTPAGAPVPGEELLPCATA